MKNLKKLVIGFLFFNCFAIGVIAQVAGCSNSVTVNGATCPYDRSSDSFCYYRCPAGEYRGNRGPHYGEDPGFEPASDPVV